MYRRIVVFGIVTFYTFLICSCARDPKIDVWYGRKQHFGRNGYPQKWMNILGRVESNDGVASLEYSLNDTSVISLSIGPDGHRLAKPGDFNIEIDRKGLQAGKNTVEIFARNHQGHESSMKVVVWMHKPRKCELSYTIDWSDLDRIDDAAQVVDGLWELTAGGVKVIEPYCDRVIAFGDQSWQNYEVTVPVTFHGMRQPVKGTDGGAGVIHAAIAVNWPGHDEDSHQPHVKWYPLGATAEFRLEPELNKCSWRILGGAGKVVEEKSIRPIEYWQQYIMKHRIKTLGDSSAQYSVKLWRADEPEPEAWDLQKEEDPEDILRGGALIIAHYTVVTFGDIGQVVGGGRIMDTLSLNSYHRLAV